MKLFKEIVNESLILELRQGRENDVKNAINNVLRARIVYDDKKGGKGKRERFILPVAFGIMDSNGKKAIRAYETMGSSKRGLTNPPNNRKYPKWKLFLYDNIVSWANGKKSFADYKDLLIAQGLNTHGDKHMSTLFAITPFADDDVQVSKTTSVNPISPEPVTKTDVTPSTKLQNKATTDKDKFISAGQQRANNVDNEPKTDYTNLEAPDTEPISKQQISAPEQQPSAPENPMKKMTAKTSPVTKDEIENGENKEDVVDKFKDLTKRMDNLYNDEEEDEENAGK